MRKLMEPLHVPDSEKTKSKILTESARMFALSGYSTVSIRDIANTIGIQPASLYGHFASKQDILDHIMLLCESELNAYYEMMDRLSNEADSFFQILKNIFAEPKEIVNPFCFYALYCASTNQFEFESCRRLYFDNYFQQGHLVMRRQLDIAIHRGLVKPFDTKSVASIITNSILNLVSFSVGHINGYYQEFNIEEWYDRTINLILEYTGAKPKDH